MPGSGTGNGCWLRASVGIEAVHCLGHIIETDHGGSRLAGLLTSKQAKWPDVASEIVQASTMNLIGTAYD